MGQPQSETGEVKFIEPNAQNKGQDSEIAEKPTPVVMASAAGFFIQTPIQFAPAQSLKPMAAPSLPKVEAMPQAVVASPTQLPVISDATVPVASFDSSPTETTDPTHGGQPLLATRPTDPILLPPGKPLDPQRDEWIEEVPAPGANNSVPPPSSDVASVTNVTNEFASDTATDLAATSISDGPTSRVEVTESEDHPVEAADVAEAQPKTDSNNLPPKDGPQKIDPNPEAEQRRNPDIPLPDLDDPRNDSQVRTSTRSQTGTETELPGQAKVEVETPSNVIQTETDGISKPEATATKVDQSKAASEQKSVKADETPIEVETKVELNVESTEPTQTFEAKPRVELKESEVREHPTALPREQVREVLRQVEDRIEFLAAARPKKGVTIHLEPRELGTITLNIVQRGSEVEAKVDASLPAVREALAESRHEVTRAMESRGLQLNVSVGSDSHGQWDQAKPQQNHRGQVAAHHDERPVPDENQTRATRRAGRDVDLWI